ncbi:MAG: alpha/beta hydrolase fold domain-containing protein [Pseudomonadota bacterium]
MLPEVRAFLDAFYGQDVPDFTSLPVEVMREAFSSGPPMDAPGPELAHVSDHLVPGPAREIPVRIYDPAPESAAPTRALVFMHGGGFVIGDLDSHDGLCRRLADGLDMPVIAVHYRLAPEHPFPAAYEDALAATQWSQTQLSSTLGRPVSGVICCGDSAGGNLAAAVSLHLEPSTDVPIDLQVLLYPVVDLAGHYPSHDRNGQGYMLDTKSMAFFADTYCPDGIDRRDPRVSPIYAPRFNAAPPAIIVAAELDPLYDEAIAYAKALKAADVPVTLIEEAGMLHGFFTMTLALPSTVKRTETLINAIKSCLA